ncbi:MAG: autoinducer binding domain-containing protein [Sphingomonadaceae bacterium]|nr:autoinducer binding domain-containing protein [Sphingomonadaceae bacterium]
MTLAVLLQSIAELGDNPDVLTLRRAVVAFAKARGFGAAFFLSPIARNNRQGRVLTNVGFNASWERAYRRGLSRIDPLPEIAMTLRAPFRWSQAARLRDLTASEQRYMAILERCGMGDGLAYPLFGSGANSGLIGLGHHPDLAVVCRSTQIEIQLFLQSTYQAYCNIIAREFAQDAELSERERDVLFWLAQSKSNSAIAAILEIAPSTVDTYMRRIFRKLGVSDRVGAAIAAVQQGHITPSRYRREHQLS